MNIDFFASQTRIAFQKGKMSCLKVKSMLVFEKY